MAPYILLSRRVTTLVVASRMSLMHAQPGAQMGQNFRNSGGQIFRNPHLSVLRGLSSRFEGREVFVDNKGKPVTPERALSRFKAAAKRAKVEGAERLRFHDLRHTCGTTLIEMGVDIYTIKEILGHHSVQMTERYLHAKRDRLRDALKKLDGTLRAQSTGTTENA